MQNKSQITINGAILITLNRTARCYHVRFTGLEQALEVFAAALHGTPGARQGHTKGTPRAHQGHANGTPRARQGNSERIRSDQDHPSPYKLHGAYCLKR